MEQLSLLNKFSPPHMATSADLMNPLIPFDAAEALLEQLLQEELENFDLLDIAPVTDTCFSAKWKLSSGLQKGVRRGLVNDAVRYAISYYRIDAASFWKRLPIIVLEDIGVADPLTVAMTLAAARSTVWRKRVGGDELVIQFLVKRMAGNTKDRSVADMCQILDNRTLPPEALFLLKSAPPHELSALALSDHQPYEVRIAALWMLCGTNRMQNAKLPHSTGSLDWFNRTVEEIKISGLAKYITLRSMVACRGCSMNICYAFVWEMLQKSPYRRVVETELPEQFYIGGGIEQAWDMHTRQGKAAYQHFYRACEPVQNFLTGLGIVGTDAIIRAISVCVFICESALLDKRIDFAGATEIYEMTVTDDFVKFGLNPEDGEVLTKLILENSETLRLSRQRVVTGTKHGPILTY
ncbi:MAG: hypothetical protein JZU65_20355 [Chlorobium sp.]|nr:hypothetical protein [Chlorobium sp.]